MLLSRKMPEPLFATLLSAFALVHGHRIGRNDPEHPVLLDDDCVRVLEWLWRNDRANAVKLHTWILLRIKEAGRRPVRADHLVPRLDEALRRLRLTRSSEMARGLAQASEHASRQRRA